jgi:formiminotetrahydrofolate cyclodeaminase
MGASATTLASVTLSQLIDDVARPEPTPGGGAVAAIVASLAGALAAMAGHYAVRRAPDVGELRDLVERASRLRSLTSALADEDAAAYARYVEALTLPRDPDPEVRARAVHVAADAAADVPLQIARAAREIAELGERLAVSGAPALRSDACTATLLASAVAASAAILVGENLRKRPEDPRVTEAGRCAAQAAMAARNVVAPFDHLRSDAS